jgi:hypothetical protein
MKNLTYQTHDGSYEKLPSFIGLGILKNACLSRLSVIVRHCVYAGYLPDQGSTLLTISCITFFLLADPHTGGTVPCFRKFIIVAKAGFEPA